MLAISQLLLTQFWWNFKGRFLWTFRTNSNCQGDICTCNICPYQEYPNCYSPDFDQTLKVGFWDHLYQMPTIKAIYIQSTYGMFFPPTTFFSCRICFCWFCKAVILYPVIKSLWKFLCILFGCCRHTQIFNLRAKINRNFMKIWAQKSILQKCYKFYKNWVKP